jgi:hypothetical protein
MTLPVWPDADVACLALLTPWGETGLRIPDDGVDAHLPYILLHISGGSDDRITDYASLDISVYHRSLGEAKETASAIRSFLEHGGPHIVGGQVIDRFGTTARPQELPFGTPDVFRVVATYQTTSRRQ